MEEKDNIAEIGGDFDLDQVAVDPAKEKNGQLFVFGGTIIKTTETEIITTGVPFVLRHFLDVKYQRRHSELQEERSFALRGNDDESMRVREKTRCDAMAEAMILRWGDGIEFEGKKVRGKNLVFGGNKIIWSLGTNGITKKEIREQLSMILEAPKYRKFKEQMLLWSQNDNAFNRTEEAKDAQD